MSIRHRRPLIDTLEARQLFHATVDLTWTFSPGNPSTGTQIADHGGVYKIYGNYTFGWATSQRDQTRTTHAVSNATLDSYIHVTTRWELAVPNGMYRVTLTSGDAKHTDSVHVIDVEGVRIMNGTTTATKPFRTQSGIVDVEDGKLTLHPDSGGQNVKLSSLRLESVESATPATVSLQTVRSEARERPTSDAQSGLVRVIRTGGELGEALNVKLAWSGSAGSKDIVARPTTVTIPAGQTLIEIPVVAKTDSLNESPETATLAIVKDEVNYKLGVPTSTSIRVANTNAPVVTTPEVSINTSAGTAREGGSDGVITLSRTGGDASQSLVVDLTWSGSAGSDDVDARPDSITFAAGALTTNLTVHATDDLLVETNETATVTIDPSSRYTIDGTDHASVTVVSDDTDTPTQPRNSIAWSTVAASPDGASEGQTAVVNNLLYRFGGYRDTSFVASRKAERYDPTTNAWTSRADMPIGFTHSATAVVGTKVWFAGAYEERVGVPGQQNIGTTRVLIYDTVANTWTNGPSLPEARGSGGMVLIANKLYFTSGERLSDRADVGTTWMYDLDNAGSGWQTRADLPAPRSHFGTVAVDGIMYVLGGQTGHDSAGVPLKSVYAYDPATNAWTQKNDLPSPISHQAPATVAFEGKIYSFGGDDPANVARSQVTEYNPATGQTRILTSLPGNRLAGIAGVINGDQFIFNGGYDTDFRTTTWLATWS